MAILTLDGLYTLWLPYPQPCGKPVDRCAGVNPDTGTPVVLTLEDVTSLLHICNSIKISSNVGKNLREKVDIHLVIR